MVQSVYDDLSAMPDRAELIREYDDLSEELNKLMVQVGSIVELAFTEDPSGLRGVYAAASRISKRFDLVVYGIDEVILLRKNGVQFLEQAFCDRSLSHQSM